MLTPAEIKDRLADKVLLKVAEDVGLNYHTVRRYALGEVQHPRYEAISKLSEYLSRDPMEG